MIKINKDNCILFLTEIESGFLLNRIKNDLSSENIAKQLQELYYKSNNRYYRLEDIAEIAVNLKEEVGRHMDSDTSTGNFTIIKLLSEKGVYITDGIDHNSGKEMLTINVEDKDYVKYFNSPSEVHVYLSNLYSKFM